MMNKYDKIMLVGAIPIIVGAAILDYFFVKTHTLLNYIIICSWEYTIFWFGMAAGREIGINEMKFKNGKKKNKQ